jgi:hypothetical protein
LLDACFDRIAALLRGVAGALEAREDGRLVAEHIPGLDEERFFSAGWIKAPLHRAIARKSRSLSAVNQWGGDFCNP